MTDHSWQFKTAITRKPGKSVVKGLRSRNIEDPKLQNLQKHHAEYIFALRKAGAEVIVLNPLENYPDSLFVEDTALCLPKGVVLMNPGALSRRGEVQHMAPKLQEIFSNVKRIEGPATIEAGDILVTSIEILVGESKRTNEAGINQLTDLIYHWGYSVRKVSVPDEVLPFKSDCSVLGTKTILSTPRLFKTGVFQNYEVILTAEGEEEAANAVRFNDFVLMSKGFPKTFEKLKTAGYNLLEIENSEFAKLDGGMSCLSLRF